MTQMPIKRTRQFRSTITKAAMASTVALLFACATSSPDVALARASRGVAAYAVRGI